MELLTTDPRVGISDVGTIEQIKEIGVGIVRILAPNSSLMTLDGTNTYVVYDNKKTCYVVDPGPSDQGHLDHVKSIIERLDLRPKAILLTHQHLDHSEGGALFSQDLNVEIVGRISATHGGDIIDVACKKLPLSNGSIKAIPTPGHSSDHCCFLLPSGELLSGDHILGRGTSMIAFPDGNLEEYLQSLAALMSYPWTAILPGHGPAIPREISKAAVAYYYGHRIVRLAQIVNLLKGNSLDPRLIVQKLYEPNLDADLFLAAESQTRASLAALVNRCFVTPTENGCFVATDKPIKQLEEFLIGSNFSVSSILDFPL